MATHVTMPQLGETVVEGTITRWLKHEGEAVERDEPLFEISTDKVDTEVPSPVAGTLVRIVVQEGETVGVGTSVAEVDEGGAGAGAVTEAAAVSQAPAAVAVAPAAPAPVPAAPEPAPAFAVRAPAERGERSHILSPLVRRLAEENRVDLSLVTGTGTGGRITKNDILAHIAQPPAVQAPAPIPAPTAPAPAPAIRPVPAPAAPGAGEEVVPLTRMRQLIAQNMVASLQTTARAWNTVEVNVEELVRVRTAAKDAFAAREGFNLTYMPFLGKAVCDALLAFPEVNAELRDDAMVLKRYVNLGIAVALDEGLIVPVVKGADSMSVVGLARAINDVATRARTRRLTPDDVQGSTFTITNPGPFGGSIMSVPVINPPNCAILAFDAIEKRPVVIDDAIAIRHMVYLSLAWDHRIIDGAAAAKFLARLKQNLETWDFGPEVGLPARG